MATATLRDTDRRLRDVVMRQLEWDPRVNASEIGVAASGGTVTLTGYIDTYAGKLAAERAAKRVRGVRAVANELMVRLRLERPDPDIAQDALAALVLRASVPPTVQIAMHEGRLTLTGTVSWYFQKEEAEKAVRHVHGVRAVMNHIEVVGRPTTRDVKRHIVAALHRSADLDARHIGVAVDGGEVILTGRVSSWLQREAAGRAAGYAPGITSVDNMIAVDPPLPLDGDEGETC